MIWPAPPHCGQGWLIEKKPWLWASMPRPSQRGQVTGLVPGLAPLPWQVGQRSAFGTVTLTWVPLTAWSKLRLDLGLEVAAAHLLRLRPRRRRRGRRCRREDVAEVDAAEAARRAAAAERAGPAGRRAEAAEHPAGVVLLALLGVGERVVGAAEISLNFSSASGSSGLRSGWYLRASLRYAFLISSSEAFLETPSTL